MKNKIKLYFKEFLVGELSLDEKAQEFVFEKNKNFHDEFILDMVALEKKSVIRSGKLFYIFKKFIPSSEREDLIKKANITKEDDAYSILIKVAKLDLDKDQFWISL